MDDKRAIARRSMGKHGRAAAALALAWSAGFVDAAAFLLLKQVFVSHMSGNTAETAQHWANGQLHAAWTHAWPILAFVAGLALGAGLMESARRRRYHSRAALVLGAEAAVLLVLVLWGVTGTRGSLLWVGLPALAMGMQTVTITRIGDVRVYTTYMTGMLAKCAEAFVSYGFAALEARRGGKPEPARQQEEELRRLLLNHGFLSGGLWGLFLFGGLCGALAEMRWAMAAMLFPMGIMAATAVLDLKRPIAPVGAEEPPGFLL